MDTTNQSVTINYTSDPDIYMESRIAKRNVNAEGASPTLWCVWCVPHGEL